MSGPRIHLHSVVAVGVALLGSCAIHVRPPEPDYRLTPGGIGVAVERPVLQDRPDAANYGGKGAAIGAVSALHLASLGPAGIAAGILLSPFTAIYGAVKAGSCAQKFSDAYPPIGDKLEAIVQREFPQTDVADAFAVELRNHTAAPVSSADVPHALAHQRDTAAPRWAASQPDLAYVFVIEPTVQLEPTAKCEGAEIAVRLKVTLWSVAEARPIGLSSKLFAWQRRTVRVRFDELASILDEPGALRSRFVPEFKHWATDMYYHGGFQLPESATHSTPASASPAYPVYEP
jgi:hypothetical protein